MKFDPISMQKSGKIAFDVIVAPPDPPEPAHEAIYRQLCAQYEIEHQQPPTAWRRYLLYEDARLEAIISSCGEKRQCRLPQKVVEDAVRIIDDVCQKSSSRKPWRKKSAPSKSDRLTNNMLKLAIKKKLTKRLKLGVVRATATVGCTGDYFTRIWFGTVFFCAKMCLTCIILFV